MNPATVSARQIAAYAGSYGTRHVTDENGQLFLQLANGPKMKLVPMTAEMFSVEGAEAPRLRFTVENSGKSAKLTEIYPDGRKNELARQ